MEQQVMAVAVTVVEVKAAVTVVEMVVAKRGVAVGKAETMEVEQEEGMAVVTAAATAAVVRRGDGGGEGSDSQ